VNQTAPEAGTSSGLAITIIVVMGWVGNAGSPDSARAAATVGEISSEHLPRADGAEWLTPGRDCQESYHSPLKNINKSNVGGPGFAWAFDIDTTDGFEATPIVVQGVMFSSGPQGAAYAIDTKTGARRWTFAPQIDPRVEGNVCCGRVNRGVAVWEGLAFVASLDGYLYALDADSGTVHIASPVHRTLRRTR